MDPLAACSIRPAVSAADFTAAAALLESYFASLRENATVPLAIRQKDRKPELSALANGTGADSVFLLAWRQDQPVGCITAHLLPSRPHAAEIKRLYVAPAARGSGLGSRLIQQAAQWARHQGARELLLDTLPRAMPEAVRLYQALGFTPTERYNSNAQADFAFYRLNLQ